MVKGKAAPVENRTLKSGVEPKQCKVPEMSRPANIPAAVKELFRQPRFKSTWNMLTSSSPGERAAAMEAVGRALERNGLTFLDVAQSVVSPQSNGPPVERRVEVPMANTFIFIGRVDIIEFLEMDAKAGEFANRTLLHVTLGTRAFRIEPVVVINPCDMDAALSAAKSRADVRAHLVVSRALKIDDEPCCFAQELAII